MGDGLKKIFGLLILLPTVVCASSSGPLGPKTGTDNAASGTVAWSGPGNIVAEDGALSTATLTDVHAFDSAVYLLQAGSIVGTNHLSGTEWPSSLAYSSYGGSADLWGTGWVAADINNGNFGAVLQASSCVATPQFTHYLQATDFGFAIPSNTRIDGILLEIKKAEVGGCGITDGGGASFVAGTEISTPDGRVPIERIQRGDVVWSFSNEVPHHFTPNVVRQVWSHSVEYVLNLRTKSNRITTTPEHKFFTGSNYSEAKYLAPSAKVMTQTRYGMITNRIEKNEGQRKKAEVYEFSLDAEPHNYIANGFGVHNPAACATGECAVVDYMRITVTYTVLPQIGTNAGNGSIGTNAGAGQIKFQ